VTWRTVARCANEGGASLSTGHGMGRQSDESDEPPELDERTRAELEELKTKIDQLKAKRRAGAVKRRAG
jgi:hypothetical protein